MKTPGTKIEILNGMSAQQFLREYWQKKPLLIRGALPQFKGFLNRSDLQDLARRDDVQARMVVEKAGLWRVLHGPLHAAAWRGLRGAHWSLLVQGIEQHYSAGRKLLAQFDFIPYARLDDVMVSFAPQGGGVGPHLDSYDVFLLQGGGHKRWQISAQPEHEWVADAPLRLLKNFRAEQEFILGPGDMLYLPPKYAHYGLALNDNYTYSIGFRTASRHELLVQFLNYLQDRLDVPGMYEDPDLAYAKHPAEIDAAMLDKVYALTTTLAWQRADVAAFLGAYLTEPKPHVVFDASARRLSRAKFQAALGKRGVRLALKSQMLFSGRQFFMNGEALSVPKVDVALYRLLADSRALPSSTLASLSPAGLDTLYEWYRAAYLELA